MGFWKGKNQWGREKVIRHPENISKNSPCEKISFRLFWNLHIDNQTVTSFFQYDIPNKSVWSNFFFRLCHILTRRTQFCLIPFSFWGDPPPTSAKTVFIKKKSSAFVIAWFSINWRNTEETPRHTNLFDGAVKATLCYLCICICVFIFVYLYLCICICVQRILDTSILWLGLSERLYVSCPIVGTSR